ncbi:hypothetical protein DUI87_13954 [Hirundo rustica rustica]|uniref:Uncharacterized protein n=1 Tax=Hirundo rustica rustica TaxID=333673 RepID=A0A3M0K729_HIRRU|nr:hypothetical protein DUI87_13954 [Hirundo rustica rustica]
MQGCRMQRVACSPGAPPAHRGVPFRAVAATGQNPGEENEGFRFDIVANCTKGTEEGFEFPLGYKPVRVPECGVRPWIVPLVGQRWRCRPRLCRGWYLGHAAPSQRLPALPEVQAWHRALPAWGTAQKGDDNCVTPERAFVRVQARAGQR